MAVNAALLSSARPLPFPGLANPRQNRLTRDKSTNADAVRVSDQEASAVIGKPRKQGSNSPSTEHDELNTEKATGKKSSEKKNPKHALSKSTMQRRGKNGHTSRGERGKSPQATAWASSLAGLIVQADHAEPRRKKAMPSLPTGAGLNQTESDHENQIQLDADAQKGQFVDGHPSTPGPEIADSIIRHMLSRSVVPGAGIRRGGVRVAAKRPGSARQQTGSNADTGEAHRSSNTSNRTRVVQNHGSNLETVDPKKKTQNGDGSQVALTTANEQIAVIALVGPQESIHGRVVQIQASHEPSVSDVSQAIAQTNVSGTLSVTKHSQRATPRDSSVTLSKQAPGSSSVALVHSKAQIQGIVKVPGWHPGGNDGAKTDFPLTQNARRDRREIVRTTVPQHRAAPASRPTDVAPLAFALRLHPVRSRDGNATGGSPTDLSNANNQESSMKHATGSDTSSGERSDHPGNDVALQEPVVSSGSRHQEGFQIGTSDSADGQEKKDNQQSTLKAPKSGETDAQQSIQPAEAAAQSPGHSVEASVAGHAAALANSTPLRSHVEHRTVAEPQVRIQTPAHVEPTSKPEPAPLARPLASQLSVRLSGPEASPVDLKLTERNGEIQVAVRTANADMQTALRGDLTSLVDSLKTNGFETGVSQGSSANLGAGSGMVHHVGATPALAQTDHQDAGDTSNRNGQDPGRQQDSPRQQQGREQQNPQGERGFLAWIEQLTEN